MRIITLNLNGIRSATGKGFFAWALAASIYKARRFSDHALLTVDYSGC